MQIIIAIITSFYLLPLCFSVFTFTVLKIEGSYEDLTNTTWTYKKTIALCFIPIFNLILTIFIAIQTFKQLPNVVRKIKE